MLLKKCFTQLKNQWHCIVFLAFAYIIILAFELDSTILIHRIDILNQAANQSDENENENPYDMSSSISIYGEDKYCDPTQKSKHGYKYKTAVVIGLYNTGTNSLFELLQQNCWGQGTSKRLIETGSNKYTAMQFNFQIRPRIKHFTRWYFTSFFNISKHQPSPSLEYLQSQHINPNGSYGHHHLNVVLIKDPLTWIKSICKQSYYLYPIRDEWFLNEYCPYGIHKNNGTASANHWHVHLYPSLIDIFNKFYESWMGSEITPPLGSTTMEKVRYDEILEYVMQKSGKQKLDVRERARLINEMYANMIDNPDNLTEIEQEIMNESKVMMTNVNVPTIVVRFEDVLFHPDQIINRVCNCVGGYARQNETVMRQSASKMHGDSRNRSEAERTYADKMYRYENYGLKDIEFIKENVNDTILKVFGYDIATDVRSKNVSHNVTKKKFFAYLGH